ncbi:O-antigen ligase family protein [Flagellimonas crocea]|uniref:O-antigen ligase family protein n=1 Tax=Flagellimonas crocea TaxID=3067311 RepID=UPI00296EBC99|nr:O-antigen ligase family protein [Muricauda sp. DH64]
MKQAFKYLRTIGLPAFLLLSLYFINPFNKGFLAGYIILGIVFLNKNALKKEVDTTFLLLTIFSFVYAAFYAFNLEQGVQWLFIYAFFPQAFYLLGKRMVVDSSTPKNHFYLLFVFGTLYSVTGLISVGLNLLEGGFVQLGRTIPNFWTGKETLATAMGAFFIFNMSIPGLLIASKRKLPLIFNLIALGIFVISMLCVFRLGSRTQLVLVLLGILIAIAYRIKSQSVVSNFKFILVMVVIVAVGINYLSVDLDAEYLSSLGQRLQDSENAASAGGRTVRWEKSLINLYEKPLGWSVDEFGYSHNMWFDAARNGTTISFILLVIVTIKSISNIRRALRANKNAILFNSLILIYNVAIFSQLFVEPALESLFILFVFYCFIQGLLNEYSNKEENRKIEQSPLVQE